MPSLKSALLPYIILRLWKKKLEALKLQVAMNRLFSFGPMRGRQLTQIKNKWVQVNIAEAIKQTWDLFYNFQRSYRSISVREKNRPAYDIIDRSPKDFYIFRFLCILYRLSYAQYTHIHTPASSRVSTLRASQRWFEEVEKLFRKMDREKEEAEKRSLIVGYTIKEIGLGCYLVA